MREITVKISSNDGMYIMCMTSVTTFSQKREYMLNFSQGKKWKFINVPSSLDVQRLKKLQVPESFQDEPNPLPQFLKAKEGIDYVTSKGSKSTPQFQSIVGTPEKTFVPETQNIEKSPEEIPMSPDPPAKRRKKRVSQQVTEVKGECPLCGRLMRMKVLQEHAANCNGSDRSCLIRLSLYNFNNI